jgi:2-amino-4-hydroxy-6-hydroxymethyldihydropteridine diphosphokinase
MHMAIVYLGLGSNLGDRAANVQGAIRRLGEGGEVHVRRVSALTETAPFGVTQQPPFINAVVEVETALTPRDLLARVKQLEQEMGRVPSFRWGPRLIDIDLLHYEGVCMSDADLTLPHPGILERDFVWRPLAELAPQLVDVLRRDATLSLRSEGRAG